MYAHTLLGFFSLGAVGLEFHTPSSGYGCAKEQLAWLRQPVHFVAVSYDVPFAYMKLVPEPRDNWLCSRNWCAPILWTMENRFKQRPPGVYARRALQDATAGHCDPLFDIQKMFKSAPLSRLSELHFQLFTTLPEAVAWMQANGPKVASPDGAYSSLTVAHPSSVNMFAQSCLKCESAFSAPVFSIKIKKCRQNGM